MEPLSSIATAIGALLGLATAAINLAATIRSRTRRNRGRDQQQDHPEGSRQPGR
jgi:hypothetical protein